MYWLTTSESYFLMQTANMLYIDSPAGNYQYDGQYTRALGLVLTSIWKTQSILNQIMAWPFRGG